MQLIHNVLIYMYPRSIFQLHGGVFGFFISCLEADTLQFTDVHPRCHWSNIVGALWKIGVDKTSAEVGL